MDGTLIEALGSHKSYRPGDVDGPPGGGGRNPKVHFHGERRSRDTQESKTDKYAYLFKKTKGAESKQALLGHILMENRHGLVVGARVPLLACVLYGHRHAQPGHWSDVPDTRPLPAAGSYGSNLIIPAETCRVTSVHGMPGRYTILQVDNYPRSQVAAAA